MTNVELFCDLVKQHQIPACGEISITDGGFIYRLAGSNGNDEKKFSDLLNATFHGVDKDGRVFLCINTKTRGVNRTGEFFRLLTLTVFQNNVMDPETFSLSGAVYPIDTASFFRYNSGRTDLTSLKELLSGKSVCFAKEENTDYVEVQMA